MLAAKLERLPVTLGTQRGRFVHRHVANGVFGHMSSSRDFILLTMYACHPQQPPALAGGLAPAGVDRNFCRQPSQQKYYVLPVALIALQRGATAIQKRGRDDDQEPNRQGV